jgi:hypothetical protein
VRRSLADVSAPRNRLFTVLLLAVWLVATQHCGLEAATEFFGAHSEESAGTGCCPGDRSGCVNDGCEAIEDALYKSDVADLRLPAPQLAACLDLSFLPPLVPPTEDLSRRPSRLDFERPLDWLPTWQFVQRAALSPRAPSVV